MVFAPHRTLSTRCGLLDQTSPQVEVREMIASMRSGLGCYKRTGTCGMVGAVDWGGVFSGWAERTGTGSDTPW